MLETSKDLLNIMLGSSVLLVSLLFSWILFEIAKTIKSVNKTVGGVQKIVDSIDNTVNKLGDKMGNAVAFFTVLAKGGQQVLDIVQSKKETKKKKTKTKK